MSRPVDDDQVVVSVGLDALGGIVIEGGPDSVLGAQAVDVGDLARWWVDPVDPTRLVRVTLADAAEAGWLLDELLGPGAGAAIVAAAGRAARGEAGLTATIRPTQVAHDVGRLGLLLWLEDGSPLPLDQGLLDAEIATILRTLPGESNAGQARRRARAAMETAMALLPGLSDGDSDPDPAIALGIHRMAGALLAVALPTAAEVRGLVRLVTAADSARIGSGRSGGMDADLMALFRSEVIATSLGDELIERRQVTTEARYHVDWRMVPRGALNTDEGTIRARWTTGVRGVEVSVSARRGAPPIPLFVRVVPADGTAPIALTPLRFDPSLTAYLATIDVRPLTPGDRVDVYSASASEPPLSSPAALRQAAALRCAARAFSAMRLAAGATGESSTILWKSAADDWLEWMQQHSGETGPAAARDRDIVLSALARCQAQLGSAQARRTAGRRSDSTIEPDWTDPAAAMSLAEGRLVGLL